jgi:hypothetical protein
LHDREESCDTGEPEDQGGRKAFLLRLPPELHADLKRWAAAELRSLNGQIEFLLRDALRRRKGNHSANGDEPQP